MAAAGVGAREELGPPPGAGLGERDLGAAAIALASRLTPGEQTQAVWVGSLLGLVAGALIYALAHSGWVLPLAGLLGAAVGTLAPPWLRETSARARLKGALEVAVLSLVSPARSYLERLHARIEAAVRQAMVEQLGDRACRIEVNLSELAALLDRRRAEHAEGLPHWAGYLEEARGLLDRAGALLDLLREGAAASPAGDGAASDSGAEPAGASGASPAGVTGTPGTKAGVVGAA